MMNEHIENRAALLARDAADSFQSFERAQATLADAADFYGATSATEETATYRRALEILPSLYGR